MSDDAFGNTARVRAGVVPARIRRCEHAVGMNTDSVTLWVIAI
jgi:hypothetical protein